MSSLSSVVITTAELHSAKSELRFCAVSNPFRGVSEICNDEELWQWSRVEVRLNTFRRSTIPQNNSSSIYQFIIIVTVVAILSFFCILVT